MRFESEKRKATELRRKDRDQPIGVVVGNRDDADMLELDAVPCVERRTFARNRPEWRRCQVRNS